MGDELSLPHGLLPLPPESGGFALAAVVMLCVLLCVLTLIYFTRRFSKKTAFSPLKQQALEDINVVINDRDLPLTSMQAYRIWLVIKRLVIVCLGEQVSYLSIDEFARVCTRHANKERADEQQRLLISLGHAIYNPKILIQQKELLLVLTQWLEDANDLRI